MTVQKQSRDPTFGRNLRRLRLGSGMNLREVAASVGISHVSVSYMESGRNHPSWDTAVALAKLFRVSLDEFTRPGYGAYDRRP